MGCKSYSHITCPSLKEGAKVDGAKVQKVVGGIHY